MPQPPRIAGGEGFTFERSAAAFYLTALLDESYAPGIDNRIVVRVLTQQRDLDEPFDDVVVGFADQSSALARLSLANHESERTTGRYDQRSDQGSLDEVERIGI